MNATIRDIDTGEFADSRAQRLGGFLDQWLEEVARPKVRHWTYVGYEVHIRVHIKPTLGRFKLDELRPIDVQRWMNAKQADGLSAKSVRYMRGTLRTALNQAVRWGLISRNAAALVDPPQGERREINPLTPDEARAFLGAIRGDRLEALYSVALSLGLRQGEALGLRWEDVDLDRGILSIRKQLQRINGAFQLVDLKTTRSRRSLALPATVVVSMRQHQARQAREGSGGAANMNLVFTSVAGTPLEGTTVSRQFHRHLDRAGLPQRRFHDLRHSCATLLLAQGVSPRVVMEVLGHSDIGMTMNTYTHVIPELRRDAANRMDDLLRERG